MKTNKYRTNILFGRNSFTKGMGSVLNISGNYFDFNHSKTSSEADFKALRSDWGMVGQDIINAGVQLNKSLLIGK